MLYAQVLRVASSSGNVHKGKKEKKKKDRSFSPSFVDPAGRASLDYAQHTHSTIAPLVSSGVINVE